MKKVLKSVQSSYAIRNDFFYKIPHTGDTVSLDVCKTVVDKGLNMFQRAQVSAHVAATHQILQHQTLNSQIQMEGPYDRLA